jgi:YHS domain-containing protein
MVGNALTPAPAAAKPDPTHAAHEKAPAPKSTAASSTTVSHDHHGAASTPAETSIKPVNTQCAICGMPVDPNLPTLQYEGKTIGFGCKMCAPKFKANPDKYGPIYLRNEVIKN